MHPAEADNYPVGLYVHIPFCRGKCRYCDFYSITDTDLIPLYLQSLHKEMVKTASSKNRADTLYIGGGTPSLLHYKQIGQIVDWAAQYFNLEASAEMTLEVNPATVTVRDLQDYAAFGFNRLNIGIQSFNDANLSFLGRRHNADQAMAAVKAAKKAGFSNIGLDLIYGLPEQTPSSWKNDLLQAMRLAPRHLSCYMLSYEPQTPLYVDKVNGRVAPLSDLRTADLFRITHDYLGAAGYEHYEISNFSQGPQHRSVHNQKYWNFSPYIGLGPSAHSCRLPFRWWNHRSMKQYLNRLDQNRLPIEDKERLTIEQQLIEGLYLGLRQSDGIVFDAFQNRHKIDFKLYFNKALDRFDAEKWIDIDAYRCRLTAEGMLFLDHIVNDLVERVE